MALKDDTLVLVLNTIAEQLRIPKDRVHTETIVPHGVAAFVVTNTAFETGRFFRPPDDRSMTVGELIARLDYGR